jgi:cellulose biosynthesis protein BcsQ
VLAVVSNKGGVGKTTVATNLAVYLRAMREDLPILLIGLDDQPQMTAAAWRAHCSTRRGAASWSSTRRATSRS